MTRQELLEQKESVVGQFGPWTAHNVHLGGGVYTIDEKDVAEAVLLRRVVQVIHDIAHRPLRELRILDLACLEGLYGIELALQGAKVVGIEARQVSLEKARFVKRALNLTNLELVQDDVRHISAERYGRFDAVLCAGILYHLDVPDVFQFIERIFEMSTDFTVFETHVSVSAKEVQHYRGRGYFGFSFPEHSPASTADEKAKRLWSSIDNLKAFWFTKPSLLNFLSHTGFTSVYECHNPSYLRAFADRVTLVAIKGTRKPLLCSPPLNSQVEEDWPEKSAQRVHPAQQSGGRLREAARRLVPGPAKGLLRRFAGLQRG